MDQEWVERGARSCKERVERWTRNGSSEGLGAVGKGREIDQDLQEGSRKVERWTSIYRNG